MFCPSIILILILYPSGERALRAILEEALKIAERCSNPEDRDAIVKMVGDISSMTDALCELRSQGKVRTMRDSSGSRGAASGLCRAG